jgi:RNA-binding protein
MLLQAATVGNQSKPPIFFVAWRNRLRQTGAMDPLTNAKIRELKARAQRMKATLKIGKEGLSPQFFAALDEVLNHHELVKVKFDEFKEQKKELTPQLAEKSGSHLITRVGNVVVLYRPKPEEGTRIE